MFDESDEYKLQISISSRIKGKKFFSASFFKSLINDSAVSSEILILLFFVVSPKTSFTCGKLKKVNKILEGSAHAINQTKIIAR